MYPVDHYHQRLHLSCLSKKLSSSQIHQIGREFVEERAFKEELDTCDDNFSIAGGWRVAGSWFILLSSFVLIWLPYFQIHRLGEKGILCYIVNS